MKSKKFADQLYFSCLPLASQRLLYVCEEGEVYPELKKLLIRVVFFNCRAAARKSALSVPHLAITPEILQQLDWD